MGASKSGAVTKRSAPVAPSIAKRAASAPPAMLYTAVPPSTLLDVTLPTAVRFSATVTPAVAPPPWLVISGASLTLVTVMAMACVAVPPLPSATCTVTS